MAPVWAYAVGICLGALLAPLSIAIASLVLFSTRHMRNRVLPAFFSRDRLFVSFIFLAITLPVTMFVIGGSVVIELAASLLTMLLEAWTGLPAIYPDVALAGPIEEPMKLLGAIVMVPLLALVIRPRRLVVRDAMAAGAIVGMLFGGIEAFLYLSAGTAEFITNPSFFNADAVVWRILFGAFIHGTMSAFAASMLGAAGWKKLWTVVTLAIASLFHALLNLASTLAMDDAVTMERLLLTDALQICMIIFFFCCTALVWHYSKKTREIAAPAGSQV